ncbi:hypothetical protein J7K19_07450, partial [bacterium]|nr:hypothetical protein [bacterium]
VTFSFFRTCSKMNAFLSVNASPTGHPKCDYDNHLFVLLCSITTETIIKIANLFLKSKHFFI